MNILFLLFIKKDPIILIPGLYSSNLIATYNQLYKKKWYCPSSMNLTLFWLDYRYTIPPFFNCLMELLKGHYDPIKDEISSDPGLTIETEDFGGEKGLSFVDKVGFLGKKNFPVFHNLFKIFQNNGYTIKQNLFGAPYDWRIAVSGIEKTFFPKLKNLIEESYKINYPKKVTLYAFSLGGLCLHRFLTEYVDEKWKNRYIEKQILISPSIGGSPSSLLTAWNQVFPYLPFLQTTSTKEASEFSPTIYSNFPNSFIFENKTLIIGPNNETYNTNDLFNFFIKHQKITEKGFKLYNKSIQNSYKYPINPNITTYIIYNSGVLTLNQLDFNKGFNKKPQSIFSKGDGTILSDSIEWICKKWSETNNTFCYDLNNNDSSFIHHNMVSNDVINNLIYQITTNSSFQF